jgi:hydroxymethylpyrimidine/phosphomethylpyrimidine kinase
MVPIALTIAGSDSSGGAGIQADLKTFAAFGVYGASVITALTAQSTRGVHDVADVAPAFVGRQLDTVLDDLAVGAAKTGMLWRAAVLEVLVERLRARPLPHLVVDPVLRASSGAVLLEPAALPLLRTRLLPLATLVTPNLDEAGALTGRRVTDLPSMRDAARALVDLGARAALVTGGHLPGDPVDVFHDGHDVHELPGARIGTGSRHGTGCTLSAAITAGLARGEELEAAVRSAKDWLARALRTAPAIGHGPGPVDHLVAAGAGDTPRRYSGVT